MHWLPVPQRIGYKIAAMVWSCLRGIAPAYLLKLCWPVSALVGRRARRSFSDELLVPRVDSSTAQRRAFSVVASSISNIVTAKKQHSCVLQVAQVLSHIASFAGNAFK